MAHRNMGAPFPREDGETWETGEVHEATERELATRAHKLVAVDPPSVEEYATGNGWFEIPGVGKVQGKEAAQRALADTPDEGDD